MTSRGCGGINTRLKSQIQIWRANLVTGLAVVLPAVLSLIILKWGFGTVAGITDTLLFFVPRHITHADEGRGLILWYWSAAAFVLALVLITAVGRATRYYVGKRIIQGVDLAMRRVPLLNKIYGTIQQVNQALSSTQKSSFKQVVLVQYPRPGLYSMAFLTSDEMPEPEARVGRKLLGVFVPTTPNPTSGFLVFVPSREIVMMDMSVGEGMKLIISGGGIIPPWPPLNGTNPQPVEPAA